MLGLGIPEMVLIMVAALLIFGPKRLPEIGQSVGKAMREFKKGVNDIKDNFENVIPEDILSDEVKTNDQSPVSSSMGVPSSDNVAANRDQSSVNTTASNPVSVDISTMSEHTETAVRQPESDIETVTDKASDDAPKV